MTTVIMSRGRCCPCRQRFTGNGTKRSRDWRRSTCRWRSSRGPPGPGMIPNDARGPALESTASTARQATRQHRRMYMQGDVHRGTKVTGSASNTRKFLNNQNTFR